MIKDIRIQNFRCFEDTKISGFERVNLIGGKNNAGKTALLEALLINDSTLNLLYLNQLRRNPLENSSLILDKAWDNLFFNQQVEQEIIIFSADHYQNLKEIKISVSKTLPKEIKESPNYTLIFNEITKFESSISVLKIEAEEDNIKKIEQKEIDPFFIILNSKNYIKISLDGRSISLGNISYKELDNLPFLPPFLNSNNQELTQEYDRSRLDNKDHEVLRAFKILDPSIQTIESFSIGVPTLYLTRTNQKRLPLSLFGDAINRVAHIILKLINKNNDILLIDEIENGIHYTNQREFWRNLFRLSLEFDTQIFATTHSLEMIQAFTDVGLHEYPNQGAYFELAVNPRNKKIVAIKREQEVLDYALKHNDRVRGE